MDINNRQQAILEILGKNSWLNRSEINESYNQNYQRVSFMTISREISYLLSLNLIVKQGEGRSTKYMLSPLYNLFKPINPNDYFNENIDQRKIFDNFNFAIFDLLKTDLLTKEEIDQLKNLNEQFQANYKKLSQTIRYKELERATIELSWKSSELEGNTYTLLETETLIREGVEAKGRKQVEAIMILNHKKALQYILSHPEEFSILTIAKIEYLNSLLMDNLGVAKNIRKSLVGITGTNYKPLDNVYQIKKALEQYCYLINGKQNVFEKAMMTLFLVSYIQPFEDGNKRTGRILANALLLANNLFPISLRSLDVNEYKEAMIIFYEQNNIYLFKKIFIQQCEFAVANYFKSSL